MPHLYFLQTPLLSPGLFFYSCAGHILLPTFWPHLYPFILLALPLTSSLTCALRSHWHLQLSCSPPIHPHTWCAPQVKHSGVGVLHVRRPGLTAGCPLLDTRLQPLLMPLSIHSVIMPMSSAAPKCRRMGEDRVTRAAGPIQLPGMSVALIPAAVQQGASPQEQPKHRRAAQGRLQGGQPAWGMQQQRHDCE